MPQTEFRSYITNGVIEDSAVTMSLIAADTSIAVNGPVVLAAGADDTEALPKAASTTTAGDAKVFGVCVRLPKNGTITANTSPVEVCIHGLCKVLVADANVALNDPLETTTTAAKARVQPDPTVDATSLATLAADVVIVANNVRKCFGIALSAVSSGANSIVLAFVNINACRGNVT